MFLSNKPSIYIYLKWFTQSTTAALYSRRLTHSLASSFNISHFCSSNDKKVQLSVIEKLLDARKSSIPLPSQPRNIYQEFFDHPHTCYPTRPESINLPTISTIEELKQMVLEKSKGLAWQSGTKDGPSRSNEWLYQMVECGNITNGLVCEAT